MLFHNTYGVDMGNDTIKISDRDERKFLMERNVIAIRDQTHVIAVGQKAFEMYEKTPVNVEATCPIDVYKRQLQYLTETQKTSLDNLTSLKMSSGSLSDIEAVPLLLSLIHI